MSKKNQNHSEDLVFVKCDFCNSTNHQVMMRSKDYLFKKIPGIFSVVKCDDCNLIFINPRLSPEKLSSFFTSKAVYYKNPKNMLLNHRFFVLRRNDILTEFFKYPQLKRKKLRKLIQYPNYLRVKREWKTKHYIPKYIKNGHILEIGCSNGFFIYQLKKLGWNVKGVELNKNAADYAVNILKLDVVNKSFEDFQTETQYDYIFIFYVLESMEAPKAALKKCFSLLKPKGKIVMKIPDFSGIDARLYKKYAYTLQLPYQLYHFTPLTIRNYLKELNFKKIKIYHDKSERDLINPLAYLILENPHKTIYKIIQKFLTISFIRGFILRILINFLVLIGKTSRMTIIVEK